ncbi:porin family protein [Hymenobacter sp. CRA2]|uniref:porin family protein n=1 Tax=Hymenobacter sp. CRA2 TaxID=1955620 RepID=UPI00098F0DE0|nr:porin family protein [Hymenobacter sp. CRA2]OON71093.1 hypothetical protein B0919_03635 [Hymenobacter sp. CRA2]
MTTRLLLLSALLIGAYAPLRAQSLQFGAKAGLMGSTYQREPTAENDRGPGRLGPTGGVWLRQPLSSRVALQAELLYEGRGARYQSEGPLGWEGSLGYYEHEEKSRLHYLAVPLLARVRAGKWFAEAGPQASYLLAGRNKLQTRDYVRNSGAYAYLPYSATESTADFRRWEIGYAAGLGRELTRALSVGLRFSGAFSPAYRSLPSVPTYPYERAYIDHYRLSKARNTGLQLQVSYQLGGV